MEHTKTGLRSQGSCNGYGDIESKLRITSDERATFLLDYSQNPQRNDALLKLRRDDALDNLDRCREPFGMLNARFRGSKRHSFTKPRNVFS